MNIELERHLVLPQSTPCIVCNKVAVGGEINMVKPTGIGPNGERLGLVCAACLKKINPAAYAEWQAANPNTEEFL